MLQQGALCKQDGASRHAPVETPQLLHLCNFRWWARAMSQVIASGYGPHTVVPTPTPRPRTMRPTMIMEMCTAPAMMPAPTMKVMPEKIRGTCATYTILLLGSYPNSAPCWGKEGGGGGSLVLLL